MYVAFILFLSPGIHRFADMYSCTELEATAREFIFQNFLLVSHTEEFFELSEDQLIGLLQSDKLHVTNENQVRAPSLVFF